MQLPALGLIFTTTVTSTSAIQCRCRRPRWLPSPTPSGYLWMLLAAKRLCQLILLLVLHPADAVESRESRVSISTEEERTVTTGSYHSNSAALQPYKKENKSIVSEVRGRRLLVHRKRGLCRRPKIYDKSIGDHSSRDHSNMRLLPSTFSHCPSRAALSPTVCYQRKCF